MTGNERSRHRAQCDKSVFNLSGMTREEAETLIVEKQGTLCVRYFQRKDGTILTQDCVVGISKKRKRVVRCGCGSAARSAAPASRCGRLAKTRAKRSTRKSEWKCARVVSPSSTRLAVR